MKFCIFTIHNTISLVILKLNTMTLQLLNVWFFFKICCLVCHWEVGFNIRVNQWEKCWWIMEITEWHKFLVQWDVNARMNTILLREKVPFQSIEERPRNFVFWAFGSVCETCVCQDRWPIILFALILLYGTLNRKLIHTPQMLAQLKRYTCISVHKEPCHEYMWKAWTLWCLRDIVNWQAMWMKGLYLKPTPYMLRVIQHQTRKDNHLEGIIGSITMRTPWPSNSIKDCIGCSQASLSTIFCENKLSLRIGCLYTHANYLGSKPNNKNLRLCLIFICTTTVANKQMIYFDIVVMNIENSVECWCIWVWDNLIAQISAIQNGTTSTLPWEITTTFVSKIFFTMDVKRT